MVRPAAFFPFILCRKGRIFILLDIHSHILPAVDDGAQSLSESVELLKMMQAQGITHVIATPHFYPLTDTLDTHQEKIRNAYKTLSETADKMQLPRIYLGSEVLYYRYIGSSESIHSFCLNGSHYLLLELTDDCIGNELFDDILNLRDHQNIPVIIAHLERYHRARAYKKLLAFLREEQILAQLNASSLFIAEYAKTTQKLIRNGYVQFLATDAHSPLKRPPMLEQALRLISEKLGTEYTSGFIRNSQLLLERITEGIDEQ